MSTYTLSRTCVWVYVQAWRRSQDVDLNILQSKFHKMHQVARNFSWFCASKLACLYVDMIADDGLCVCKYICRYTLFRTFACVYVSLRTCMAQIWGYCYKNIRIRISDRGGVLHGTDCTPLKPIFQINVDKKPKRDKKPILFNPKMEYSDTNPTQTDVEEN